MITSDEWLQMLITIFASVMASSGFWAIVARRRDIKDAITQLTLGLAHDRIIHLGMTYVDRGWITKDEYEDFEKYLVTPYSTFGGNGLADKVWGEVKRLPIRKYNPVDLVKLKAIDEDKEQE